MDAAALVIVAAGAGKEGGLDGSATTIGLLDMTCVGTAPVTAAVVVLVCASAVDFVFVDDILVALEGAAAADGRILVSSVM